MFPFIETLRIRNGEIRNLDYHQIRMGRTIFEHYNLGNIPMLEDVIRDHTNGLEADITYKCRVTYGKSIEKIEFEKYNIKRQIAIKAVRANDLDYSFKYADRSIFKKILEQNPNYSDVLIIQNGFITDTTYANIVLVKDSKLFTPSTPLLAGTMRQSLLDTGLVSEKLIKSEDLAEYGKFLLINAIMDLDESPVYDISLISV